MCSAVGAVAQTAAAEDTIDLTPRYVVDDPMFYGHELTMTQKQRYNSFDEGVVSLQMFTELRFNVTRLLPNGGAELDISFDRITVDAIPAKSDRFSYDTERDAGLPDDQRFIRAIRRVAESVVTVRLTKAGQVSSIVGGREIQRLVEDTPGFELIAGVWNEQWFRSVAQDVFSGGSNIPVRSVGNTWNTILPLTLGGIGGAHTKIQWELKTIDDTTAFIKGKGDTHPPSGSNSNVGGVAQKVTGQYSEFTILWDRKLGRAKLVESSEAMNISYQAEDYVVGTVSLGTHSLLKSLAR
jgi:Family of unknown function (DUF6263)